MKRITHQEAQQLAQNALGSFSYLLPSGEKFTARKYNGKWFVVPAKDRLRVEVQQGRFLEVV